MKQFETQRNWNNYHHNKPQTNRPPVLIIFFVVFIISSMGIYFIRHPEDKALINIADNQNFSHVSFEAEALPFSDEVNCIPNKNGVIMAQSIDITKEIFESLAYEVTINQIDDYIETIKNLNMSSDYDEFIECCVSKLEYYKRYIKSYNGEYLDKYNEIEHLNILAKCFDSADVRYEFKNDGSISFWYILNPV